MSSASAPVKVSAPDETASDSAERIRAFVADACIPREREVQESGAAPSDALRLDLVAAAKAAAVYGPHLAIEYGGLALPWTARADAFRAAGFSLLGPHALNCSAPDEGNHHLLASVATEAQQEEFLAPLARYAKRSCFLMSEPDGAGADPTLLKTVARKQGAGYVISGRKWFITGAVGAEIGIIMARDGETEDASASMFLIHLPMKGVNIVREMHGMSHESPGGHCEVELDNVAVPADAVLGEPGEAFRYAQIRLAPARLTHCMRWIGGAERAHDVAKRYAIARKAFGKELARHQNVSSMIADNEIDLTTSRLMIADCARRLDAGEKARHETSLAKVHVSEAVFRVADRCVQILGGLGVMADTPVEMIFRASRAFRIYDGPSETHRDAIAKRVLRATISEVMAEKGAHHAASAY